MAFKLGMTLNIFMPYMLMLVSMTLTLMQGHSRSAKNQRWIISTSKQAMSIKLATTVGLLAEFTWSCLDFENVYMAWSYCSFFLWCDFRGCLGSKEPMIYLLSLFRPSLSSLFAGTDDYPPCLPGELTLQTKFSTDIEIVMTMTIVLYADRWRWQQGESGRWNKLRYWRSAVNHITQNTAVLLQSDWPNYNHSGSQTDLVIITPAVRLT